MRWCVVNRPLIALLFQGRRRVAVGAGQSTSASAICFSSDPICRLAGRSPARGAAASYASNVSSLDAAVLAAEIGGHRWHRPFRAGESPSTRRWWTAPCVSLTLPERPAALAVLQGPLLRELYFWLMTGQHVGAVRAPGGVGGHAGRLARDHGLLFGKSAAQERSGRPSSGCRRSLDLCRGSARGFARSVPPLVGNCGRVWQIPTCTASGGRTQARACGM